MKFHFLSFIYFKKYFKTFCLNPLPPYSTWSQTFGPHCIYMHTYMDPHTCMQTHIEIHKLWVSSGFVGHCCDLRFPEVFLAVGVGRGDKGERVHPRLFIHKQTLFDSWSWRETIICVCGFAFGSGIKLCISRLNQTSGFRPVFLNFNQKQL